MGHSNQLWTDLREGAARVGDIRDGLAEGRTGTTSRCLNPVAVSFVRTCLRVFPVMPLTLDRIASDFGIHEMTLSTCLHQAHVEDGIESRHDVRSGARGA